MRGKIANSRAAFWQQQRGITEDRFLWLGKITLLFIKNEKLAESFAVERRETGYSATEPYAAQPLPRTSNEIRLNYFVPLHLRQRKPRDPRS
jgi:hypothetical protein